MRRTAKPATKSPSNRAEVRTGGVWATTPPFAHAVRSFEVSRGKDGRVSLGTKSCEDTRSTTELSNHSWDVPQCVQQRAPSGRRRGNRRWFGCVFERLLCPGSSASPFLAAVMDRWPSFSRFGSRKLPRFHRCLQGWPQLTPARTRRAMPAQIWEGIAPFSVILLWQRSSSFCW